jgi:hypothetical protein
VEIRGSQGGFKAMPQIQAVHAKAWLQRAVQESSLRCRQRRIYIAEPHWQSAPRAPWLSHAFSPLRVRFELTARRVDTHSPSPDIVPSPPTATTPIPPRHLPSMDSESEHEHRDDESISEQEEVEDTKPKSAMKKTKEAPLPVERPELP